MKILVFGGSGKIGTAVAWDLAQDPRVTKIGLVGGTSSRWSGRSAGSGPRRSSATPWTSRTRARSAPPSTATMPARSPCPTAARATASSTPPSRPAFRSSTCSRSTTAPGRLRDRGARGAAGDEPRALRRVLHEKAAANGVPFIDGMGFAAGSEQRHDGGRDPEARPGRERRRPGRRNPGEEGRGLSAAALHDHVAFDHVLREYMIRLLVRQDGKVVEVDAGTGRERFVFDKFGQNEPLECAITPGMPSFITSRPELEEFARRPCAGPATGTASRRSRSAAFSI